ncbi:hypothetical protein E3O42_16245 [Cryobacterium adonitolivorans]|uniref:LPXTG cell wall anchor domain-containing protein n=1 Tax=Cryobacterium adonitolivorans TaxID=1259189 RepID=A0A4R8VZP3_9MICO|nr:hypothetical protein [Cryobacterium adonitolivorans]TFB97487.1 hypothetical protein E3O42_16245 [Cryobacterium adonitolivorans]
MSTTLTDAAAGSTPAPTAAPAGTVSGTGRTNTVAARVAAAVGGVLASTGAQVAPLVGAAALLLAAGGVLIAVRRLRHRLIWPNLVRAGRLETQRRPFLSVRPSSGAGPGIGAPGSVEFQG